MKNTISGTKTLGTPHTAQPWYTLVVLSVRRTDGGQPFRFEYQTPHIGRLDAELRARAEARRQGLIDWVLLSIEVTNDTKTLGTP
jgi:hypothetical protein